MQPSARPASSVWVKMNLGESVGLGAELDIVLELVVAGGSAPAVVQSVNNITIAANEDMRVLVDTILKKGIKMREQI